MLASDVHLKLGLRSSKDPSTSVVCLEFFLKKDKVCDLSRSSTYGVLKGILAYFLPS